MSENEEIVENTKATMGMEGLPLPDGTVRRIESYLDGERSLEQSIGDLLDGWRAKQADEPSGSSEAMRPDRRASR